MRLVATMAAVCLLAFCWMAGGCQSGKSGSDYETVMPGLQVHDIVVGAGPVPHVVVHDGQDAWTGCGVHTAGSCWGAGHGAGDPLGDIGPWAGTLHHAHRGTTLICPGGPDKVP